MTETVEGDGWMLCMAADITNLRTRGRTVRQDRDMAIKASYTDDLTGVANRRFVTARMEEMLQTSNAAGDVVGCVCILDLDNFKYINDRFGHQAGDIILRDFAKRIQARFAGPIALAGWAARSSCWCCQIRQSRKPN